MPKRHKVLITGSSGMLGIDLCQEIKKDYDVAGIDLVRHPKSEVDRFYAGDITDKKGITAVIAKARPDIVIHCAAWTDVDGCELNSVKAYEINSNGARNVALACKAVKAALIYISTDFVFDGRKKTPYKEIDKTGPLSVYGASKLRGEALVKKTLKNHFILRTSWLYGKYGKNFVDTISAKGKTESVLRVVQDQSGSPTYTKYLAKAIHRLLDKLAAGSAFADICKPHRASVDKHRSKTIEFGTYHVSNTGQVSWYDYAREILRLTESGTKVVPITSKELARPARRPAMSVMDNSKFIKFTDYRMPDWKVALKEYLINKRG